MPDVVTGLLLTEKIEGMLKSTLVTVPAPAPIAVLKLLALSKLIEPVEVICM